MLTSNPNPESDRLQAHYAGTRKWLKWGPYLSERQWGTVREDYSPKGTAWEYFTHEHARSKTYRWGEDGIAGICDRFCNLCFAIALWNGHDPFLKERLFGLSGPEGNHGEDVKELYYYLDSTPTHSYLKHLYKYPRMAFPYQALKSENRQRSRHETEFEILDTGVFEEGYYDVFTEYAKVDEEDICIRITVHLRGDETGEISVLPTLWFRNLWSFGLLDVKPKIGAGQESNQVRASHPKIGDHYLYFEQAQRLLFTENETNEALLYRQPNAQPFVKDAFHHAVVENDFEWLADKKSGTKFSPMYQFKLAAGEKAEIRLRLSRNGQLNQPLGAEFEQAFAARIQEADLFYQGLIKSKNADLANIQRQAFAGVLWTKQYYNLDIPRWLEGDPGQIAPPESRKLGRNRHWSTLNNEDIISMPDKWEYPWYAAWDLAFHCVPLAMVDMEFAKRQLILFLREWYMHPNGQLPAYEWAFGDVNPPVHAWACLQLYKMDKKFNGREDKVFLKRVFQKLLINFTWWVNRKDDLGNNIFEGGFLGLDNIGVFDRSSFIPGGGLLEQADGTAWMAMYCLNMLEMALILGEDDLAYEDVATKFFEHFTYIAASLNQIDEHFPGCWDPEEGFFYDVLSLPNRKFIPLKVRSLVGLTTLFAVMEIKREQLQKLPGFYKRLKWFQDYREKNQQYKVLDTLDETGDVLLSLVPKDRLEQLLQALFDEKEFLSPAGIRSLSKVHEKPYVVHIEGQQFGLSYDPGESTTGLFGGNSNWRGPVWMPMNYLIGHSLRIYAQHYGSKLMVEFPTGSGHQVDLDEAADEISRRLISIFQPDETGKRIIHGNYPQYQNDPHFKDLLLFYEYFHGNDGHGLGASHQTGWTGLVAEMIDKSAK